MFWWLVVWWVVWWLWGCLGGCGVVFGGSWCRDSGGGVWGRLVGWFVSCDGVWLCLFGLGSGSVGVGVGWVWGGVEGLFRVGGLRVSWFAIL